MLEEPAFQAILPDFVQTSPSSKFARVLGQATIETIIRQQDQFTSGDESPMLLDHRI